MHNKFKWNCHPIREWMAIDWSLHAALELHQNHNGTIYYIGSDVHCTPSHLSDILLMPAPLRHRHIKHIFSIQICTLLCCGHTDYQL